MPVEPPYKFVSGVGFCFYVKDGKYLDYNGNEIPESVIEKYIPPLPQIRVVAVEAPEVPEPPIPFEPPTPPPPPAPVKRKPIPPRKKPGRPPKKG